MNRLAYVVMGVAQAISFVIFAAGDAKAKKERQLLIAKNCKLYLEGAENANSR